ncbi:HNH endonuclease signature motif containing protein [Nocardioides sp. InS609-2]|uniref:HNH endonuclease n=1 Tax=Nocardioides sp. InS609-2 TaxID=2760705 RepID=UPI0020BD7188|nr:HNH endonuclease signature motif containing protein [Nocardioides sp. InS609-2]
MSAHDAFKNTAEWQALRVECGSTEELQADHIKPASLYPELALDIDNMQTLCGPCNRRKSDSNDQSVERLPWLNPRYPELADLVFLAPS